MLYVIAFVMSFYLPTYIMRQGKALEVYICISLWLLIIYRPNRDDVEYNGSPTVFRGDFTLPKNSDPKDTYLRLDGWFKVSLEIIVFALLFFNHLGKSIHCELWFTTAIPSSHPRGTWRCWDIESSSLTLIQRRNNMLCPVVTGWKLHFFVSYSLVHQIKTQNIS